MRCMCVAQTHFMVDLWRASSLRDLDLLKAAPRPAEAAGGTLLNSTFLALQLMAASAPSGARGESLA